MLQRFWVTPFASKCVFCTNYNSQKALSSLFLFSLILFYLFLPHLLILLFHLLLFNSFQAFFFITQPSEFSDSSIPSLLPMKLKSISNAIDPSKDKNKAKEEEEEERNGRQIR